MASETVSGPKAFLENHWRKLVGVAAVALFALPFVFSGSRLYLFTLSFIYAILAFAAIAPIGYSGQLILSQGAFFGVGAYTFIKVANAGVPTWLAIPAAIVVTTAVAYALGKPATRATGIYLGIITLAFNEMFVLALDLFPGFFGGSIGMPSPDLYFPDALTAVVSIDVLYFYVALVAFVGSYLVIRRLVESEHGWALLALHEETIVAESVGIDTQRYRLLAFSLSGAICGLAGGIYAPITGYITPTLFNLDATIEIILAAVAGGITTVGGAIIGGMFVVFVPEVLRFLSEVRFIVYGVILIVLLIFVPEGIGGWIKERFE
ncbi:branched-chain amino acid ABC transporter permease [Halorarum halobium]|uniref:branched-chain amino acid ABC transporter permease n=1 Tax=Halorarum halobium TaxID=3075121 RepID=UPI0028A89814|nr:branched-chain amino acid ABC transporter permease [Halobaculum sp. XH14]